MSNPELKPCPFCGGEAASLEDGSHSTAWEIGCYNGQCAAEPHVWEATKEKAIAAWNRRADLPPADAAVMNGVANTVLSSLSLESEEVARIMTAQAVRETQE